MFSRLSASLFTFAALTAPPIPSIADAQSSPSPVPMATTTPDATPGPAVVFGGVVSAFSGSTSGVNATGALASATGVDKAWRADFSNALITVSKPSGEFRYTIYTGEYAFPTVGQALNATLQKAANTNLYSALPVAYVQYVPNATWSISAGKLPTLLGQENGFTFQNVNIQRGLGWAMEPTISRGVRGTYSGGKFTGNLEYSDGYYTGSHRAFEGSAAWQVDASTSFALAFIVPQADTPGNATAGVANKREFDFMITKQYGKLQLLPYLLYVYSPASSSAGFASDERAVAASLIANYAFSDNFSLAARVESASNHSLPADTSANADLVGYGPGSTAQTLTITPQYKYRHLFVRGEYSRASLAIFTPGLGFGSDGKGASQSRLLFEIGAQY